MAKQIATHASPYAASRGVALRHTLGRDWLLGWLMVAPVVLIVVALLIYPFVDAILLSFQDRFIGQQGRWIGLDNYRELLGRDSLFIRASDWGATVEVSRRSQFGLRDGTSNDSVKLSGNDLRTWTYRLRRNSASPSEPGGPLGRPAVSRVSRPMST